MRQNHALNPWGKLPIHELCKSQMGQALCNCAQHCNATVYTRNTMQLCIITKSASVQLRAAGFSQKYAKLVGSSTIYGFLLAPPTHLLPPAAFEKNAKNPNNPGFGICLALASLACLFQAILSQIKRSDGAGRHQDGDRIRSEDKSWQAPS